MIHLKGYLQFGYTGTRSTGSLLMRWEQSTHSIEFILLWIQEQLNGFFSTRFHAHSFLIYICTYVLVFAYSWLVLVLIYRHKILNLAKNKINNLLSCLQDSEAVSQIGHPPVHCGYAGQQKQQQLVLVSCCAVLCASWLQPRLLTNKYKCNPR